MPDYGTDRRHYDVIIVGAGACGSFAAKALAEGGLSVALFEAGGAPTLEDLTAISTDRPTSYTLPPQDILEHQPIQALCYACRGAVASWFVDDYDEPYLQEAPFQWIRMRALGGRMLAWEGQSYRIGDRDFSASRLDGFGEPWPLQYRDLAPFYSQVESYLGVTGVEERHPMVPDGSFIAPRGQNVTLKLLAPHVSRSVPGRIATPARLATMTCRNHRRQAVKYAKDAFLEKPLFYTPLKPLYDAALTGRVTIFTRSVVKSVEHSANLAKGVTYVDERTRAEHEVAGSVVLLCASTLSSTRLMLSSGIGISSGLLGKGLMDHTMGPGASGTTEVTRSSFELGGAQRHRVYVPRFRNVESNQSFAFLRGYGYQAKCVLLDSSDIPSKSRLVKVKVILTAFGETLALPYNRVSLDKQQADAFGLPTLSVKMTRCSNDRLMAKDAALQAAEMLAACGARDIITTEKIASPGLSIHEVGTARMGNDPGKSVLTPYCEVHDIANVFVTDGACWVSSGCANPTLTMIAMTLRSCDFILRSRDTLFSRGRR